MPDAKAEAEKLMRNLQREQCYLIMMLDDEFVNKFNELKR